MAEGGSMFARAIEHCAEGSGLSDGVNYAYRVTNDHPGLGTYEIRVHRYFLDYSFCNLFSQEFFIGGHAWQFQLKHEDSWLTAYVWSLSKYGRLHYSITAVNHLDSKSSVTFKRSCGVEPRKSTGCLSGLMPIKNIKDRNSGFLNGDVFVIRLAMRVELSENEYFSARTSATTASCQWMLKYLHSRNQPDISSPIFKTGPVEWQLSLVADHPTGNRMAKSLAFIVSSLSLSNAPRASVILSAINRSTGHDLISDCPYKPWRFGETGSLSLGKALQDKRSGFLINGWIELSAHVTLENQTRVVVVEERIPSAPPMRLADDVPKCVFCLDKSQTHGVLHGDTSHKCYCSYCAGLMKHRREGFDCPICGKRAERIIEMF